MIIIMNILYLLKQNKTKFYDFNFKKNIYIFFLCIFHSRLIINLIILCNKINNYYYSFKWLKLLKNLLELRKDYFIL